MAEPDDPRVPVSHDAVQLIGAMQDWARKAFATPADGHGGADCQWCPLCQFVAALRGDRPEVTDRVAEAGTAVVAAFRALIGSAPTAEQAAEPRSPRVQRIDLGDPDR